MGVEFNINVEFDEKEIQNAIADHAEELVQEWLESEARDGSFECECGSISFDIETWENANNDIRAAGICRECNDRMEIDVDTSELDELRG